MTFKASLKLMLLNLSFQRMAALQFEEDPSAIMRMQEDGEPSSSSPHMLAVRVGR